MHAEPRYTYGGDEFIVVELSEEMSLEANFQVTVITQALQSQNLPGVIDICPANASYMVRYNPDVISADVLMEKLKSTAALVTQLQDTQLSARIVDIPILFEDPWTHDAVMKARDRHQDPNSTDIEYAARINGFDSKEAFIQALTDAPYLVSMTGFVPGLPWCFQIKPRNEQIEVPKYVRPRTYTPERAFGFGGAFACIYPVQGAGGYQLFGIAPGPIFDKEQRLPDFHDSLVFPQPGDIFSFRSINMEEYEQIREQVADGTFTYKTRFIDFVPEDVLRDPKTFAQKVSEVLYSDQSH